MRPRIADIVTIAARLSRTPEAAVVGERRYVYLCAIRHAIYATAREWGYSYPQIGKHVGNRDHTSVLNSIQSRERLALQFKNFDGFCAEVSRWADELPPFVSETGWKPPRAFSLTLSRADRLRREREAAALRRMRQKRRDAKIAPVATPAVAASKAVPVADKAPDEQYTRRVNAEIVRGSANLLEALRKAA